MNKKLGKIQHGINVAEVYETLANEDEKAARSLKASSQFRHSMYFFIQAMEKRIRSKIFSLVNPNNDYFRKENQHHSINEAVEFLIEIVSADDLAKLQIKDHFDKKVFIGINFQALHNKLRYPSYSKDHNNYSTIHFSNEDCLFIENINEDLKKYLLELKKLQ
jgi:hypothetical protein